MSERAVMWAWERRGVTFLAKVVLLALAFRANDDDTCIASQADLATDCELSTGAVGAALMQLERRELVTRETQPLARGKRLPSRYRLHTEVEAA